MPPVLHTGGVLLHMLASKAGCMRPNRAHGTARTAQSLSLIITATAPCRPSLTLRPSYLPKQGVPLQVLTSKTGMNQTELMTQLNTLISKKKVALLVDSATNSMFFKPTGEAELK